MYGYLKSCDKLGCNEQRFSQGRTSTKFQRTRRRGKLYFTRQKFHLFHTFRVTMAALVVLSLLLHLLGGSALDLPQSPPIPNPLAVIEQPVVSTILGEGTCPAEGPTELYALPGETANSRTCTVSSNPPENARTADPGTTNFWKSGNNVMNSSLTLNLAQVSLFVLHSNS